MQWRLSHFPSWRNLLCRDKWGGTACGYAVGIPFVLKKLPLIYFTKKLGSSFFFSLYCFLLILPGAANHHSQSTLRPPLPPPHNHHTLSHQSANSLNRNTLRGGRNPIHAPAPGTGDGPTTPESVQLQDSWVLNSNVPLETRSENVFIRFTF